MNAPHWSAVRALFDDAAGLAPEEREAFVRASGASEEVCAEVLSLLDHGTGGAQSPDGFLSTPALSHAGERLGAWRLIEPLGMGGMGEVWLAHRADGAYVGEAAVKMLKRGMDSAAVLARFAQERQALARLDHAHIARLLDAGLSPQGLPYFVMERVQGQPIDAASKNLPLEAKLTLFLQLADAVAYAHRHLLVHRDLKPGNVLVNDQGQVKLLDFGIAKALAAEEGSELTLLGPRPFTPSHASPEQVRGEPVSTATDVYSLGVVLYQMLTGQRPYGRSASSPHDVAQAVLNEPPTKPSALGTSPGQIDWQSTRHRLKGDLDNILLKALEKEPARRYASVDALAADLRAWMAGYPVAAHAPSKAYVLSKFVRRHRASVVLGLAAALALTGGLALAAWQARVAQGERDLAQQRFKQVRQLANQLVFKYHDQIESLPGATQAREALLVDAAGFLDGLRADAGGDAQFAYELASTYYRIARLQGIDTSINIGQHDQASDNLNKAITLAKDYVHDPHMSLEAMGVAVNMHVSRAEVFQRAGRMAEAMAALREGEPTLVKALQRGPRDAYALTSAITFYGVQARILGSNLAHANLGQWQLACAAADRAAQTARATIEADPANKYGPDSLAFAVGEQAQCALLAGEAEKSEALFRHQVELRDLMATRMPDDMDFRYQRAIARGNQARAMSARGRHDEALALLEYALGLARDAVAADPGNAAGPQRVQGLQSAKLDLLVAAGQLRAARAQAERVLPTLPEGDAFTTRRTRAASLVQAARAWHDTDRRRALALAREAAELMQGNDDNAARRWLLAQALTEAARAELDPRAAATLKAQIPALRAPPPPPALQRWIPS